MMGAVKLYVNGKLKRHKKYQSRYQRKIIMDKFAKIYALNHVEHYWEVLTPDVVCNDYVRVNGYTVFDLSEI